MDALTQVQAELASAESVVESLQTEKDQLSQEHYTLQQRMQYVSKRLSEISTHRFHGVQGELPYAESRVRVLARKARILSCPKVPHICHTLDNFHYLKTTASRIYLSLPDDSRDTYININDLTLRGQHYSALTPAELTQLEAWIASLSSSPEAPCPPAQP